MKIGYYPGCTLRGTAEEFDISFRAVMKHLGVDLVELEDWSCCGATAAHATSRELGMALPARNLAIAERQGLTELVAPCAACYSRLKTSDHEMRKNPETAKTVNQSLDQPYQGGVRVMNILELLQHIGNIAIKGKVTVPLSGLNVANYYGCLLLRPPEITRFDDPEQPRSMESLSRVLGAQPVEWAFKTECCGGGFSMSFTRAVLELSGRVLRNAKKSGANVMVTACPMCHSNMDLRQAEVEKHLKESINMPILYVTQLMGLAMGLQPEELGMSHHLVKFDLALQSAGAEENA